MHIHSKKKQGIFKLLAANKLTQLNLYKLFYIKKDMPFLLETFVLL